MKTIVITGASSGIGKSTAELFSKKGWNVAATMRNLEKAAQFKNFSNIRCYPMDVCDIKSVENCIHQVISDFGKIDVLLNNAGVYETSPFEKTTMESVDQLINTNIYGVIHSTKALLPHFRENRSGMIVNISSIAGRATFPFQSVYHLTKWAVEAFSESLRYELENMNIRIKTFSPSSVKTNLWSKLNKHVGDMYPKEYRDNFTNWFSYLQRNIQKGVLPEHEALAIYKAVCDKKNILRYSSDFNTKLATFLHNILPVNMFQRFIRYQI